MNIRDMYVSPEEDARRRRDDLEAALRRVAALRREAEGEEQMVHALKTALEQTPEAVALAKTKERLNVLASQLLDALDEAKAIAVAEYESTANKQPALGVQIKMYRSAQYSEAQMLHWCRLNAPALLVLDRRKVEKAVVGGLVPDAPATVEVTAHAQLAADLSMWDSE